MMYYERITPTVNEHIHHLMYLPFFRENICASLLANFNYTL